MATDTVIPSSRKVITNPTRQKIDVAKALKLRLQGNTFEEIGAIFAVSRSAVQQALQNFDDFLKQANPGELTAYSENRADMFTVVERHLTGLLLDADKGRKASLNNVAYALDKVHNARRLETGQSTGNISVLASLITRAEEQLGKPDKGTPQPVVVKLKTGDELPIAGGLANE